MSFAVIILSFFHLSSLDSTEPFKGMDNAVLNESTFKDVNDAYPDYEYFKKWEKGEVPFSGHWYKRLRNTDEGITFFFRKDHLFGRYKLCRIRLDSNCNKSTLDGINIGTSFESVFLKYGTNDTVNMRNDSNSILLSRGTEDLNFKMSCFSDSQQRETKVISTIILEYVKY